MTSLMDNTQYSNEPTKQIENNISCQSKQSSLTLIERHDDQSTQNSSECTVSTIQSFSNTTTQIRHDITNNDQNNDCKLPNKRDQK